MQQTEFGTRKLRVAMFSDSFGKLTTTFIRNEIAYFTQVHELIYVATKIAQDDEGVSTVELSYDPPRLLQKVRWWLWKLDLSCQFRDRSFEKRLRNQIANWSPDILHFHFGYESLKYLQNLRTNIPVVIHFHGYDASQMLRKRSYVKAINREIKKHNAHVIYVSEDMGERMRDAGIDLKSSSLLRYGIDVVKFTPRDQLSRNTKFRLVQVSSLAEKKGHIYTLRAVSLAIKTQPDLKSKIEVIFTGDGDTRNELEKMVRGLGLEDVIRFIGNQNSEQVISLLNGADAFVHHSVTAKNGDQEGIPNAIIEAMAMRLPILSTYHAGIPELVVHQKNGLLCQERDVESFANQIIEITGWNKLDENREVVELNYNMVIHNQTLESIYDEILQSKR